MRSTLLISAGLAIALAGQALAAPPMRVGPQACRAPMRQCIRPRPPREQASPIAHPPARRPARRPTPRIRGPAELSVGEAVKDNTGATIGTISSLTGSGANQMAVIKMGDQSFQVQSSKLGLGRRRGRDQHDQGADRRHAAFVGEVSRRGPPRRCHPTRLVWAAALVAAALPTAAVAAVTAITAQAGAARPPESGAHDSAATLGPLAIGADVRDSTGADIGHVTRLTTGKDGPPGRRDPRRRERLRDPHRYLFARDGAAFSTVTLDALKHGWKPD